MASVSRARTSSSARASSIDTPRFSLAITPCIYPLPRSCRCPSVNAIGTHSAGWLVFVEVVSRCGKLQASGI